MQTGVSSLGSARPRVGLLDARNVQASKYVKCLKEKGLLIWLVHDTNRLLRMIERDSIDILLVDVSGDTQNYGPLIRQISEQFKLAVVVMGDYHSFSWGSEWLDIGVERYLSRPVTDNFLLANLYSVFRQQQKFHHYCLEQHNQALESLKPWQLDQETWVIMSPAGFTMELTKMELRLIQILIAAKGELIPKTELAYQVYDNDHENPVQCMDMLISRLRKKARLKLHQNLPLKTLYSGGYAFPANVVCTRANAPKSISKPFSFKGIANHTEWRSIPVFGCGFPTE